LQGNRLSAKLNKLYKLIGVSRVPASHLEKIVSGIGALIAILGIMMISQWSVGSPAAAIIVASMGASAVLIFAVPHGPLSQPWPVFGGHLVSAAIGVTCASYLSNDILAASIAVGASVSVMYYMHCIHPPGGATALSAVIGGTSVHELGYYYLITPVLINVLVILSVGVVFNAFFVWRRYPAAWHRSRNVNKGKTDHVVPSISHEDFVYALSEIDSYIDVNEHDLLRIYDLVTKKSQEHVFPAERLVVGEYYSNGEYGSDWSVRQIVDRSEDGNNKDVIIYKVAAGKGRRESGYSSGDEFRRWAKYQVVRDEDDWKRVNHSGDE